MTIERAIVASTTETVTGEETIITDVQRDGGRTAVFYLDITAIGGTAPTLDVTIEVVDPVSGTRFDLTAFAQQNTVTTIRLAIEVFPDTRITARWVIGGSAGQTFTFSLGMILK